MAARHGRNGRLYMAILSAGLAEPIPLVSDFTQDAATDRVDVTAFGDAGKKYVAGLPDAKGTYAGFWDDATAQMFTAANDGIARKFYWYPDTTNAPTVYWYGTAFFDASYTFSVNDAAKNSGTWSAASTFAKNG